MFSTAVDIANLALQYVGATRIAALSDQSRNANEVNFVYDKLRQAALRAHVWRFATRSAALRPITTTSQLLVFPNYAGGTTYQQGDIVNDTTANAGNSGIAYYISLVASNVGNTPSSSPTKWAPYFGPDYCDTYSAAANYYAGEIVKETNFYIQLGQAASINNDAASGAPWSVAHIVAPTASTIFIPYPVGTFSNGTIRSIYRLPFGYLRVAPQDPKNPTGGAHQTTGGGMQYSDFQITGNYMLTSFSTAGLAANAPLIFRFVADISDVTAMEPMFAHLLALDIAVALCETISQNKALKQDLVGLQSAMMATAMTTNMLEQGSTEPGEAEFPISRLPTAPARGGGGQIGHTINVGG